MTLEMRHYVMRKIVGYLQWLSAEEEQQVMTLVHEWIWLRRERESRRRK